MPLTNPKNYRKDIEDIIIILTNGEPIRRRGEDTFGEKYNHLSYGEGLLANDTAESLRNKNVIMFVIAVRTEFDFRGPRHAVRGWSTRYFEAYHKSWLRPTITSSLEYAFCEDAGTERRVY